MENPEETPSDVLQCYTCGVSLLPSNCKLHINQYKHSSLVLRSPKSCQIRCCVCFCADVRRLTITPVEGDKCVYLCRNRCVCQVGKRKFPNESSRGVLMEDEEGMSEICILRRSCTVAELRNAMKRQSPITSPSSSSKSPLSPPVRPVKNSSSGSEDNPWITPNPSPDKNPRKEQPIKDQTTSEFSDDEFVIPSPPDSPKHVSMVCVPNLFPDKATYHTIFETFLQVESAADRHNKEHIKGTCSLLSWKVSGQVSGEVFLSSVKDLNTGDDLLLKDSKDKHAIVAVIDIDERDGKVTFKGNAAGLSKEESEYSLEFYEGTSYKRMRKGLEMFTGGDEFACSRTAAFVLGIERPELNTEERTLVDVPPLNQFQLEAVRHSITNQFALIQGPPGTGKTKTAAAIVQQLHQITNDSVLVCAPSNIAVDQLTLRLAEIPQLEGKLLRIYAKNQIKQGHLKAEEHSLHVKIRKRVWEKHPELKEQLLDFHTDVSEVLSQNHITDDLKLIEEAIVASHSIICCTCASSTSGKLRNRHFDYLLIDEAGFASEPDTLLPMLKGSSHVVLVGDHQQLPPIVYSQQLKSLKYGRSMFERLIDSGVKPILLQVQYRMHPDLAVFPSKEFYHNLLENGVSAGERIMPEFESFKKMHNNSKAVMFFHIDGQEEHLEHSFFNQVEISAVAVLVNQLHSFGIPLSAIGIITPYEGQRSKLVSVLSSGLANPEEDVEIKNVDGFQGREKDIIIFSCVRANLNSDLGFLTDYRRLNVAITRARFGLIMVGDKTVLDKDEKWRSLLRDLEQLRCKKDGKTLLLPSKS